MGRSSKEEAARTRKRIVETASELFRTADIDQISVADVMGALGMTTGGFYKHFPSKEALAAEAIGLAFEQASSVWRSVGERKSDLSRAPCAALVENYLRRSPHRRCPMIAFATYAAGAEAGATSRDVYREGVEALLEDFIALARGGGAVNSSAGERNAMLLFAAMVGARILKEAAGDVGWVNELRDAVVEAATAA